MNRFAISLIIVTSLFGKLSAQHVSLSGEVYLHNSHFDTGKLVRIANASVKAHQATPAVSDSDGRFVITFVGLPKGMHVKVKVEKNGFEVVNQRDLEEAVVGRKPAIKVFLAPIGKIALARIELYNVSLKALTERHDKIIERLRNEGEESEAAIKELELNLKREFANRYEAEEALRQQLEATKRRLPEFAEELARVNLDFASEMYRKAYAFFQKGEIDSAIVTLDEAVLDAQAAVAMAQKDLLGTASVLLDSAQAMEEERLVTLVRSIQLRAINTWKSGEVDLALKECRNAIALLRRREDPGLLLADLYGVMGEIWLERGDLDSALWFQAMKIAVLVGRDPVDKGASVAAYRLLAAWELMALDTDIAVVALQRAYLLAQDLGGVGMSQLVDSLGGEIVVLLHRRAGYFEEIGDGKEALWRYEVVLGYPISEKLRVEVERKVRQLGRLWRE